MDYRNLLFIGIFAYFMQICLVEGKANGLRSRFQRRFMWKHMDNTVDGLMDGMASGARAMKNMLGELMQSATAPTTTYKMGSPFDFLPSETTRIKYIIRSPAGKPMKIIKVQSPKKTIRIMTVPKAIVEGKFPKSKLKFPSTEELRKIEKEQERMVEGRTPMKSSAELLAEIEQQKQKGQQNAAAAADADAEHDNEDYEDYQPQKGDSSGDNSNESNDIVSGYIPEFGNEWVPVQSVDTPKRPEAFSTIKPYPMSKLHTRIISGGTVAQPEKPVLIEPPNSNDEFDDFEDAHHTHTYEVTEETAEESVSVPFTQSFHSGRGGNKLQAIGATTTTTTATTASTSTEEEPNYPAAFLRKIRERTAASGAAAASTQTSTRFRPSETMLDTSWIPTTTTRNTTTTIYKHNKFKLPKNAPLTRTKSEKWPPQAITAPETFVTQTAVVHHAVAESLRSSRIATTTPTPQAHKSAQLKVGGVPKAVESKTRDLRQRGRIRFGDKLMHPDEFQ